MSEAQQILEEVGRQHQLAKEQRQVSTLEAAEALHKRFYEQKPRRTVGFFRSNWSYLEAEVRLWDTEVPHGSFDGADNRILAILRSKFQSEGWDLVRVKRSWGNLQEVCVKLGLKHRPEKKTGAQSHRL